MAKYGKVASDISENSIVNICKMDGTAANATRGMLKLKFPKRHLTPSGMHARRFFSRKTSGRIYILRMSMTTARKFISRN